MKWPGLVEGTLVRRYQRFKADVKLRNQHLVTALCPNTGSMLSCSEPGRTVYLSRQNRPGRRLKYTWEMIEMPGSTVGINTGVPNRLVREACEQGEIPELTGYDGIRPEVRYGVNSRIDLLLVRGEERCWVEIKNCTLVEKGAACFPDAVTSRGLKHLVELQRQVRSGDRAVMFYLVQRMDAGVFRPADSIDPVYGLELRKAARNGVEILAYDVRIDRQGVELGWPLACDL
ncbi:MAG: DNA/RNA nuclease SfsA [Deltaproteobacteria bacterium]|nr:DNA/RNA nuclease SfsA [Deltaproteobacteria bacterium]